jgi:hypothetical protein
LPFEAPTVVDGSSQRLATRGGALEPVEHRFRVAQVGRVESFGEFTIDP